MTDKNIAALALLENAQKSLDILHEMDVLTYTQSAEIINAAQSIEIVRSQFAR